MKVATSRLLDTIETLLMRGVTQLGIERHTGVGRKRHPRVHASARRDCRNGPSARSSHWRQLPILATGIRAVH